MVKRIKGSDGRTTGTTKVQGTRSVESSKVGAVDQIKRAEQNTAAGKIGGKPQQITPEIRDRIMELIDEVADRMFTGEDGLPESKKETLKGAVKMAINAAVLDEKDR